MPTRIETRDLAATVTRFAVGDRVVPTRYTRDGLSYGYVRRVTPGQGYTVYWPEIGAVGTGWRDSDFE